MGLASCGKCQGGGKGSLKPLPSVALGPASGLASMLESSRNFILEVERENDKAGAWFPVLVSTPESLRWLEQISVTESQDPGARKEKGHTQHVWSPGMKTCRDPVLH